MNKQIKIVRLDFEFTSSKVVRHEPMIPALRGHFSTRSEAMRMLREKGANGTEYELILTLKP